MGGREAPTDRCLQHSPRTNGDGVLVCGGGYFVLQCGCKAVQQAVKKLWNKHVPVCGFVACGGRFCSGLLSCSESFVWYIHFFPPAS